MDFVVAGVCACVCVLAVMCYSLLVNAYTFNMLQFHLMVIFVVGGYGGDGGGCFLSHYFATVFHTYAHI